MGIKESLKNLFGSKLPTVLGNPKFDGILNAIIKEAKASTNRSWWYDIALGKLEAYKTLKAKDISIRKEYVFYLIDQIDALEKTNYRKKNDYFSNNIEYRASAYSDILSLLLRSNLNFTVPEIVEMFSKYKNSDDNKGGRFVNWPIGFSLQQVEKTIKKEGISPELATFLKEFLQWPQMEQKKYYWGSDLEKVRVKVEKMLFESTNDDGRTAPYTLTSDRLGGMINGEVSQFKPEQKDAWYQLFHLFVKATTSKPSAKYLKTTSPIIDSIGIKAYKTVIHSWLEFVIALKPIETVEEYTYDNGHTYSYAVHEFLEEKNKVFLKGLIWSLSKFHDSTTLSLVAKLAERSFQKIPGVGPTAAGVGNACIYVLGNTKGLEGVSHLSRLKLKIKQNNTRKLIEKYIETSSEKLGVSSSEIEELSIPDFGLVDGEKKYNFDEYTLSLTIQELGKVHLLWTKPDGKTQKTTPAFVKSSAKHTQVLKKAKADVAQIKKYLTAQRDRIDRLYLDNRVWSYDAFLKSYLHHGLVSFITKKLIWQFKKGNDFVTGFYLNQQWVDANNQEINWIQETTEVRLWHPVYADIDSILFWRNKLEELEIKQPLKQAYREVYILTDAEITTKSYSNRMAAHILKQHQFNALTSIRGWKYTLMGAFDNGVDAELASILIKAHEMQAQFWINEIASDDAFNDTGIWNYVATDQVRFLTLDGETIDLINIPKLVLSEILRDVDLFVGVCSVGNDPEWRDNGGLPQYRDYWTSYSFGDLTEVAKTRKQILERLIPRLKISKVSTIDGKFLKVKGTKRTYKIHIGSTNILMEPNDQYLCIVPARGKDKNTENVFLPFEGDRGLSLILSKAFLLAADDKITDTTILSQIGR